MSGLAVKSQTTMGSRRSLLGVPFGIMPPKDLLLQ